MIHTTKRFKFVSMQKKYDVKTWHYIPVPFSRTNWFHQVSFCIIHNQFVICV